MRLLDYLLRDCVLIEPGRRAKAEALSLLVDRIRERGIVEDRNRLMEAILARESIVTTGIGGGIAIPHADLPEIDAPRLALGVFPDGVEFDALDEEPVHIVFLLLGTPRTPGLHMKILARIARLSKNPDFRAGLCGCRSAAEVVEWLTDREAPDEEAR